MSQKGLASFFSKSPANSKPNKPKNEESPGSSLTTNGTRSKRFGGSSDDDDPQEVRGTEESLPDSPIIKNKSKRRRVIIDSDDNDDDAMGVLGEETNGGANGSRSVNEVSGSGDLAEDTRTEEDSADVSTPPTQSAPKEDVVSPMAPKEGVVTPIPPRRATARKHTGRIVPCSAPEVVSSNSEPVTEAPPMKKQKMGKKAAAESEVGVASEVTMADLNKPEDTKKEVAKVVATPRGKKAKKNATSAKSKKSSITRPKKKFAPKASSAKTESGGVKEESKISDESSTCVQVSSSDGGKEAREETKQGSKVDSSYDPAENEKKPASAKSKKISISRPLNFFAPKASSTKTESGGVKEESKISDESSAHVQVSSSDSGKEAREETKQGSKVDSSYDPAEKKYHSIDDACWERGQKVPYLALARTFEKIEEETKRLKIISILTNFFRSVFLLSPDEMVPCVYLCLNKLAPAYEGLELGIGDSVLVKAIAAATGRSVQQIKADAVKKGDLGLVAETSRSTQRMMFAPPKLTVCGVFKKLREIASMSGNSSMAKKANIIKGLFVACKHSEARYLIRSLSGKLRIGLAEQSVLVSIAHAAVQSPPGQEWPPDVVDASKGPGSENYRKQLEEATLTIKSCYCEHPNYEVLIPSLVTHGLSSLPDYCHLTPGIPLKPMLAHPTKGVQEVLHRFESADFTCEWKYDGERAQIHVLEGGETRVYSRNSENNTTKYPDIIARIPKVLKDSVHSCVIDSEAVAWDTEKQQILPFQVLSTRKRKDTEVSEIKVQVCVYAFDLLYLNGKSLVKEPFKVRRELLRSSFHEIDGEFKIATSMDTDSVEEIQEFMEDSIKGNCEGLMVKTLEKNATYEIAKRSHNWLKLKKDYLEGVGDTLDLVVVGGFHGSGKRTGMYGGFLLACYDEENEDYQVICKIGTGFKDEELEKHATFFKDHVIDAPKPYYRHSDGVRPDHWFDATQVWEVKAADLSISPVYTAAAGIVDPEKGISLRFPRFLRVREDKKPDEATSSEQVASMYRSQQNVNKASGEVPDPEDFY